MHASKPVVLIVDDNTASRDVLGVLLREDGYDTELLGDGATAIARLSCGPVPDCLITDFHLPTADGLAVARHARGLLGKLAIFVVTGDPRAVACAMSELEEPFEVITKPLEYAVLVQRIEKALARPMHSER